MSGDDGGRKADLVVLLVLVAAAVIAWVVWLVTVHS